MFLAQYYIYNIYYICNNKIEYLQIARLVEHNILAVMKSQFFIGMLLWFSGHCIHQAYYLLYIFCLPKINKKQKYQILLGNTSQQENAVYREQSIHLQCKLIHWFLHGKRPGKRNFRENYSTHTKYKIQFC